MRAVLLGLLGLAAAGDAPPRSAYQSVPGTPRGLAAPAQCTKCGHHGHRSAAEPGNATSGPLANFSAPQRGATGLYVTGAALESVTISSPEECAALCLRALPHRLFATAGR